MKIESVFAKEILASAGDETVEVRMQADGVKVSASVPAGISAGKYEIEKVVASIGVEQIQAVACEIVGREWQQESLDAFLTSKKMGGNASLAISAAFFKADSNRRKFTPDLLRFPKLMLLLFEGGKHGNDMILMQEFLLVESSVHKAKEHFSVLKESLLKEGVTFLVGAEGGFSPTGFDDLKVLETIKTIFPEEKLALDAAGCFQNGQSLDYGTILRNYNVISIEDPFSDEQWEKWSGFNQQFGSKIMIVGDDLTVTNSQRIQMAISKRAINAVVIKPNQIGTISGAVSAVRMCRENNLQVVVSHRGEETDDDWIVDFAMFVAADYVKFGGMDRGERVVKYNRLLELGMN